MTKLYTSVKDAVDAIISDHEASVSNEGKSKREPSSRS